MNKSLPRESGAALIEFALVAPLCMLLLLAVLELGALMWARLSLQHAVREAGRFALTLRDGPAEPRDRHIVTLLHDDSFGVYARLQQRCVTTTLNGGNPSACLNPARGAAPAVFGAANDRVRLAVRGCWPLLTPPLAAFFPRGVDCFDASTVYRNEP
ncbi:MAG: pilus assembly protein [Paludibacterium sp.]|uniref:TadE/TadG family type IV pilus assembly protein n=1 Tax=Paludibacterium sp. TaxID=1917523 RepID=UPI0025DF3277|nr:TadE/TadG family type IV pilus assembly protein [Paludibacterium sp.]MBV8046647.1 pilus assembly protein [Paludibacterium sp.]MBV8648644.1 pilus assembly protein [Paludibacterium sp.]